jgi:DNA polymerase-3 subunit gamma/tau
LDRGADARQLARQITDYLRQLMLLQVGGEKLVDIPNEQRPTMETQAARLQTHQIVRAVRLFNQAASDLRTSWQPQLPLELAYVEAILGERQPVSAPASAALAAPHTPHKSTAAPVQHDAPAAPATRTTPAPARAAPIERKSAPAAPPPKTENEPVQAMPAASGVELSLATLEQHWGHILDVLKTHHMPTQALMRSQCKVVGVEGNTVVLSWPSEMLKNKYEDAKTKRLVEQVISEALGAHVLTRCVVGAKAKVEDDPVVQAGIKLGGRVVQ